MSKATKTIHAAALWLLLASVMFGESPWWQIAAPFVVVAAAPVWFPLLLVALVPVFAVLNSAAWMILRLAGLR